MKIENLRSEKRGDRSRVAATVIWEDCDRPTHEVYFETEEAFAKDLSCNPHSFLIGCIIPAMHYGEKRVFIDAEICPELREGLITAMSWLRYWYYEPDKELVRVEAKTRSTMPSPRSLDRAGFFFSGGIDSFATLRSNRLNFPSEHPLSIKNGLLVYGLEQDDPELFKYVKKSLLNVARDIGITLIPVYTNLYLNYRKEDATNNFRFWTYEFMGAAFAAIPHVFAKRFSVISVASSYDIPNTRPHSLNPLLIPCYSSSDMRIRLDGIIFSRFGKTKLIADWDVALQHLRVCNMYKKYKAEMLNCGLCEKCIRTMLALLSLDVLEKSRSFPFQDVSAELVKKGVLIKNPYVVSYYRELIMPLAEKGRHDLVVSIEQKLSEYNKRQRMDKLKKRIKRFDNKYLYGSLVRSKRLFS